MIGVIRVGGPQLTNFNVKVNAGSYDFAAFCNMAKTSNVYRLPSIPVKGILGIILH